MKLPLEHLKEYDAAVEYYAKHGELPMLMGSPGAIDYIQDDPEAFYRDVRSCEYANSMAGILNS